MKKCKYDNKWAVSGSDFCNLHGGQLPAIEAKSSKTIEEARARILGLVSETAIDYDGTMEKDFKAQAIERIETKREEWKEAMHGLSYSPDGYDPTHEQGVLLGLEQALEILRDL